MANYVPRTGAQKKKNILRQKEFALIGEIRRSTSVEKVHTAAEKVRSAQLGVFKSLLNEAKPCRSEDQEEAVGILERLEESRLLWESMTVDEIIQNYSG